jgi:hypothetical protein
MGTQNERDTPMAYGLRDLRSPDLHQDQFIWKGELDNKGMQDHQSNQPEKRFSGKQSITPHVLNILQPSLEDLDSQSSNYDKASQTREALKSIRKRDSITAGPNLFGGSIGVNTNPGTPNSQVIIRHGRDSIKSVGVGHIPMPGGDILQNETSTN